MGVLHPLILGAGLAAVSIPVLIHILMRRRRRPIEFGAMRFLLEAYAAQRRRLQLEQWLLLAARCLLVALIALALARPFWGALAAQRGPTTLAILLDTSIAGAELGPDGPAFDRWRAFALDELDRLDPDAGDRATLITTGAPANAVTPGPTPDLAAVRRAILDLEPTDAGLDLPGAARLLDRAVPEDARVSVLLASDARSGDPASHDWPPANTLTDPAASFSAPLRPPAPPARTGTNTAVRELSLTRGLVVSLQTDGVGAGQARVTLDRSGPGVGDTEGAMVRLHAWPGGQELGRRELRWDAGQRERTVSIPIEPARLAAIDTLGAIEASVEPDSQPADDRRRALLAITPSLGVGIVGRSSAAPGELSPLDWASIALDPEQSGALSIRAIDPASAERADLTALRTVVVTRPDRVTPAGWDALADARDRGAALLIFPAPSAGSAAWAEPMRTALDLPRGYAPDPTDHEPPLALSPPENATLLRAIEGEIEYLRDPVRVTRTLPIVSRAADDPGDPGDRGVEVLLRTADREPWLVAIGGGRGLVVLAASALDPAWTDLPTRPLVVPLLQELVRQSASAGERDRGTLAGLTPATPPGAVAMTRTPGPLDTDPSSGSRTVTDDGTPDEPIRHAGVWDVLGPDGRAIARALLNPDTRAALWMDATARADPGESAPAPRADASLAGAGDPADLGLWLLIAVFAVAILEHALARRCGHAGEDRA